MKKIDLEEMNNAILDALDDAGPVEDWDDCDLWVFTFLNSLNDYGYTVTRNDAE